jgi:hypothetical protein
VSVIPVSLITHLGGRVEIAGGTYTSISLSAQPLIILNGGSETNVLQLNISNVGFSGVESRGNFPAIIGTTTTIKVFFFF